MITINAHEKAEWARLAKWATEHDMPILAARYHDASTYPVGYRMIVRHFDNLQEVYRMWLCFGIKADTPCEHNNIDEYFGKCDDCGQEFTQDYGKLPDNPDSIADAVKRADSHITQTGRILRIDQ